MFVKHEEVIEGNPKDFRGFHRLCCPSMWTLKSQVNCLFHVVKATLFHFVSELKISKQGKVDVYPLLHNLYAPVSAEDSVIVGI